MVKIRPTGPMSESGERRKSKKQRKKDREFTRRAFGGLFAAIIAFLLIPIVYSAGPTEEVIRPISLDDPSPKTCDRKFLGYEKDGLNQTVARCEERTMWTWAFLTILIVTGAFMAVSTILPSFPTISHTSLSCTGGKHTAEHEYCYDADCDCMCGHPHWKD